MLVFDTRLRITETGLGVVEYNGYKYKVCKADVADIKDFYVFVPVKRNVSEGDCCEVKLCSLTNFTPEDSTQGTLALRIEVFDKIDSEEYVPLDEFTVKVNGAVVRTERSTVRYIGPTRAPLLQATIRVFNENRKVFNILLVGYCSTVKLLDSIENEKYINCTGVIKLQHKNRRNKQKYQLNIRCFEYVKKGGDNNG